VIISDTLVARWRLGIVNVALGIAGLPALVDLRVPPTTRQATPRDGACGADDIAAAAGLVMGKTAAPAVIVRGFEIRGSGRGEELVRPR